MVSTWIAAESLDGLDLARIKTLADTAVAAVEGRGGDVLSVSVAPPSPPPALSASSSSPIANRRRSLKRPRRS